MPTKITVARRRTDEKAEYLRRKDIKGQMNKYLSERYQEIKPSPMAMVNVQAREYDDIINLSLGDPDMITEDVIIEGAFKDAKAGYTHYSDFQGDPELIDEIAKFYKEEYGVELARNEIFVSAGGCVAMYLALEAVLNDGDEVLVQAPYFTPYPKQVRLARGVPVEMPILEENDFQLTREDIESRITEKTRALIVNSPANPTGACFTKETLDMIVDVAEEHDLIIISDEIYTIYSFRYPFHSILENPKAKERTIVINSFSKNFNMTGWRVGNIVAPPEITRVVELIDGNVVFTAPSVSQRAALHGLRHRKEIQPAFIEEYKSRVDYVKKRVDAIPKMSVIEPQGTFYMFINVKETGLTSLEVSERILNEAHVLAIAGISFGTCGEGYLRIACTVSNDVMKEAFDRIEKMDLFKE